MNGEVEVIEFDLATAMMSAASSVRKGYKNYGVVKSYSYESGRKTAKIMPWGRTNDVPSRREDLIKDNNIVASLIDTKVQILLGQGIAPFRVIFENGKKRYEEINMPTQLDEFFDLIKIDDFLETSANQLMMHASMFTEYVIDSNGQFLSIHAHESKDIRCFRKIGGKVKKYAYSPNWRHNKKRIKVLNRLPNFDEQLDPGRRYMTYTGPSLLNDGYYNIPSFDGGSEWIYLANQIPKFHIFNLENGYSVRWHIEIPKGYFRKDPSNFQTSKLDANQAAIQAEKKARSTFIQQINEFLAGIHNAGRAVFTDYEINKALGKEFPGIKIKPIKADLQDSALLELFDKSNTANISAQGIHPTLANIETAGKLSSGTEIRNAYLMYLGIKTPRPRKTILTPINRVMKSWGKQDYELRFKDLELQALSENKSGAQISVS